MLHLGGGHILPRQSVILILDYQKAVENPDTSLFLKTWQAHASVRDISGGKPKSIVVSSYRGEDSLTYSPISSVTLARRSVHIGDEYEH